MAVGMDKRYVLIKPYTCAWGTLVEGTDITEYRGNVYVNGGMVPPAYAPLMKEIMNNPEYTRVEKMIQNKI